MRTKNRQSYDDIRACVERLSMRDGRMPSVRAVAAETGIPRATVQRYLTDLASDGELYEDAHGRRSTRALRLTDVSDRPVAVLGEVACGLPTYAEENIEAYYRLPLAMTGDGECFLLRAKGQSMTEAGIDDGDLVLIRRQDYARRGQIAVVLTDEEATLKRYFPEPEKDRVRLHPENRAMKDILLPLSACRVQGVAVKVIKDL